RQLSEDQKQALALGFRFSIKRDEHPKEDVMAEFEVRKRQLLGVVMPVSEAAEAEFNTRVASICYGFLRNPGDKESLEPRYKAAIRELMQDQSIRIVKPDKQGGVVIMDTTDY
ncbi:hypothetical protein Ciccas_011724, partial [Cichlidogyrus casuarinus]